MPRRRVNRKQEEQKDENDEEYEETGSHFRSHSHQRLYPNLEEHQSDPDEENYEDQEEEERSYYDEDDEWYSSPATSTSNSSGSPYEEARRQISQEFSKSSKIERPKYYSRKDIHESGQRPNFVEELLNNWRTIVFIISVIILVIFVIKYMSLSDDPPISTPSGQSTKSLSLFKKELNAIRTKFPTQNSHLWTVIRAALKSVLNQSKPSEPAVLLVSGDEATVSCLARQLALAISKAYGQNGLILELYSQHYAKFNPVKASLLLDNKLSQSLGQSQSHVVLLHRIDLLPGNSSLVLHAYCDNEHAPFKDSAFILTSEIEAVDLGCDLAAQEALEHRWSKEGMNKDKIGALFSRIANNVICVKMENNLDCVKI